jgi:hypothetical protein
MQKQVKSCKTGILRVDFRWLYINVETQNYVKNAENPDRNGFVLTGSSQDCRFQKSAKMSGFCEKSLVNRIVSSLKKREKMVFFDFNEKALQKGSKFDCIKNV